MDDEKNREIWNRELIKKEQRNIKVANKLFDITLYFKGVADAMTECDTLSTCAAKIEDEKKWTKKAERKKETDGKGFCQKTKYDRIAEGYLGNKMLYLERMKLYSVCSTEKLDWMHHERGSRGLIAE